MPRKPSTADKRASDRVSNGTRVLPRGVIDGRSSTYRRYKFLLQSYYADLGGKDHCSAGQCAIVEAIATEQIELERQATKFVERGASANELDVYQRTANSLKRKIESLGLNKGRKPKVSKPDDDLHSYLNSKANGHRKPRRKSTARVRVLDLDRDDYAEDANG